MSGKPHSLTVTYYCAKLGSSDMLERTGNQAERRAHVNHDPALRDLARLSSKLDQAINQVRETGTRWNEAIIEGPTLSGVIYRGDPGIYDYLLVRQSLGPTLLQAQRLGPRFREVNREVLGWLGSQDLFSVKLGGTSLTDIERISMATQEGDFAGLSLSDRRRVNRMLHHPLIGRLNTNQYLVRESMIYLATQAALDRWHRDRAVVPTPLQPLSERLGCYFDYYTSFMTNFSASYDDDLWLFFTLHYRANRLTQALGCYIPARLGITPSSAVKLYQEKAFKSAMPTRFWQRDLKILQILERESTQAYRKGGLPADLNHCLLYDPTTDQRSADALEGYFRETGRLNATAIEVEAADLLAKLRLYQPRLRSDIANSQERHLRIPLSGQLIKEVMVAYQNRLSLVMVARFADGQTHLTLEVTKDGRLFGIPPRLASQYPHIDDLLAQEMVKPILDWSRRQHPEVEPLPVVRIDKLARELLSPIQITVGEETGKDKPLKRRRLRLLHPLLPEPESPQEVTLPPSSPYFRVDYSESDIARLLGNKKGQADLVKQIMNTLRRFEYGHIRTEAVKAAADLRKIRVGKYRIFLEHHGRGHYSVYWIDNRDTVFNIRVQQRRLVN